MVGSLTGAVSSQRVTEEYEGTAKLAAQDNANAKSFLQALAARGITIDPNAKTPAPPQ